MNAKHKKRNISLLVEVAAIFLIGVLITGALTYICESYLYNNSVKKQTELQASEIAEETRRAVNEYPASQWLIKYWYEHPDELDIEYDADYAADTLTAEKCRVFSQRHPDMELRYMTDADCEALPAEDQKLYAEIIYSFLITRVDQIKQSYHVDFLFCVVSEEPFDKQFFLFSAANAGHEYPALKEPDGAFEPVKDKHGLAAGAMDGMRYKEYELQLRPGSKLFVYTDGVPEATDAGEQLFGTDRMLAALNSEPGADPEGLLRNVRAAVDGFVKEAEQFDDLTMLCLEYRGGEKDQ